MYQQFRISSESDTVHRNVKTGHILVDNSRYNNTLDTGEMCRGIFNLKPIVCKLGDLGTGRLQDTQTKTMVNIVTKIVNRGSPVPQLSLDRYMLRNCKY